jgi:hypothetical protein
MQKQARIGLSLKGHRMTRPYSEAGAGHPTSVIGHHRAYAAVARRVRTQNRENNPMQSRSE